MMYFVFGEEVQKRFNVPEIVSFNGPSKYSMHYAANIMIETTHNDIICRKNRYGSIDNFSREDAAFIVLKAVPIKSWR